LPLALTLTVGLVPVGARDAAPLQTAPKRSPGEIALLANAPEHKADSDLKGALLDPDPRVRSVAARTVAVVPHGELYPDVVGALAREQDAVAAAELARDVLYLGRAANIPLVLTVAKRFGPAIAPVVAEWSGRIQAAQLIQLLPELTTLAGARANQLTGIIAMAAETHPDQQDPLVRAWMAQAPPGHWNPTLHRLYATNDDVARAAPLFKDALQSGRQTVREETLWYVIERLATKRDVPKDVLEAALPSDASEQTAWESFGRELIARRLRKTAPKDQSDVIKDPGERNRHRTFWLRALPELTAAERAAVPDSSKSSWEWFDDWHGAPTIRTMPTIAPGVIAETLSTAGCTVDTPRALGAIVTFNPDGRPQTINRDARAVSAACLEAFTALTRLAVADADYAAGDRGQAVLLPLNKAFLACSSDTEPDGPTPPVRVGDEVVPPHKIQDVAPVYPPEAQQQRIQGVIIINTTISRTGCVRDERVIRGIPYLDVAAVTAVSQWTFEPTRIAGTPVPTIMNVTVNFELR